MQTSLDEATRSLLGDVVQLLADTVGDAVVGVYPFGSIAFGDYVATSSDVDVLAVMEGVPTEPEALAAELVLVARDSEPLAGLDFVLLSADEAQTPTLPARVQLQLGTFRDDAWSAEVTLPGPAADPTPLFAQAIVLQTGSRLAGPDPSHVFGRIPQEWLLEAARAELVWWLGLPEITGHAVRVRSAILNACRARRFAVDGVLTSKRVGGEWALAREDVRHPDAVRTALALQAGHVAPLPGDSAIRDVLLQALTTLGGL